MSGNQPPWGSPPGGPPGAPNPWGTPSQGGGPSPYSGQGPGGAPAAGMPSLSSPNPPPSPSAEAGPSGGAPSPYAGQGPSAAPSPYAAQTPSPYAAQPASPYGGSPPPTNTGAADPYAAFANAPGASPYGAGGSPPPNPYVAGVANPYASYAVPVGGTGPTRSEVGGWLLLLCIGLTILVPLQMLSAVGQMMRYFGGFAGPMMMSMLIDVGIAAYSIYVGVGLWSRREKAVRHAKVYFGVRAGLAVMRMFMFPGGFVMAMSMSGPVYNPMITAVSTLAFCGVWFAYLNQSIRVRETYGSNH